MFGDSPKGLETRTTWWWPTHTIPRFFKKAFPRLVQLGVSLAPGDLTPFQYLQTFMTSFVGLADGFSDPMDFVVEDVKELERFKDAYTTQVINVCI